MEALSFFGILKNEKELTQLIIKIIMYFHVHNFKKITKKLTVNTTLLAPFNISHLTIKHD